jgi:Uma2 family endonuclease
MEAVTRRRVTALGFGFRFGKCVIMAIVETLMTAEEYRVLPDNGQFTELVRGRVVVMNLPGFRHGTVCAEVARVIGNFVKQHDLGHVLSNDSGIVTERGPDTVRGADVSFYSYQRVPKGDDPVGYANAAPELVFEVRSPDDRWPKLLAKVAEYLDAGVMAVAVLDPKSKTLNVHFADRPTLSFSADDEFTLPELLGDFRVVVKQLFE